MTNFRWGLMAAIGAFFISIILGIISGVSVFFIFIRALIFTVVFFGIGFGLHFIISSFFPELLINDNTDGEGAQAGELSGSGMNVALNNTGEYAVPELYKTSSDPRELDNIEDIVSGTFRSGNRAEGIDADAEAGYNRAREVSNDDGGFLPEQETGSFNDKAFGSTPSERQVFTPSFGDEDSGLGGLPDLDMMARAFSSGGGDAQTGFTPTAIPSAPSVQVQNSAESSFFPMIEDLEPAPQYGGKNKPQPLKGDFNPKELAEGLRTVLSKDK